MSMTGYISFLTPINMNKKISLFDESTYTCINYNISSRLIESRTSDATVLLNEPSIEGRGKIC